MLDFQPIKIEDKNKIESFLKQLQSRLCAHCFVDLYIWRCEYDTQVCIKDGFLFIKQRVEGENIYTVPLGKGSMKNALEDLRQDAGERGTDFSFHAVNEEIKSRLEQQLPDKFIFTEKRDAEDYIYSGESLMTLQGKKLHSKRNFINRFKNEYEGRWSYEKISPKNIHEVFDYHLSWCAMNQQGKKDEFWGETCAVSIALKNFSELELKGGLIRVDDKVLAFTIGSMPLEDMFIVHIEKADYTIPGLYQMINNQFALEYFEGIAFINREEDMGKDGLRKAKLSYQPVKMGLNYSAVLK
ncbi:MAG: phosphatidylglycerol lysyltransferase domain-containing protein [Oscillospiraceae bacterium]